MRSRIARLALNPVVTVEAGSLVRNGLALMCSERVGSLVVLAEGRPVGILTERDVVFAANWMLGQPELVVEQVMNKQVQMVDKDRTLRTACKMFRAPGIRHLVVIDKAGQLVGVMTQTHVIRALHEKAYTAGVTVAALMSKKVWQVATTTPARYALSLMARHAISGVLVADAERPLGFFTETDVIRLITEGRDLLPAVTDVTTLSPLVVVDAGVHPVRACTLMEQNAVRRLLVRDDRGAHVGVLTETDLSRNLEC